MATSKRLPMPEMGKVQNQTTFRQLDNIRASKVDGEIPRNAGAFAEGFEALAKLGGHYVTEKNAETDAAAKEAKLQDQRLQALRLESGANTALTEFNTLMQENPGKINDDAWIAEQRDRLLEGRVLNGVTDEFLREKGATVVSGGIERMVIEGRHKAAAYEKQTVVGDAIIRIANDFNGAIANAPSSKDALVSTGRASIENVIKGLGMDWKSAAPMLVAVAQRNAKEGKHNTFLASVLKDVDDLPAEIRMQMETFEAEGLAQTAIERETVKLNAYAKFQPSIFDGTYTLERGRQLVEQGIISADTNISWANQARSNLERLRKEAEDRRRLAAQAQAAAAQGNSVESFLSMSPKDQKATMANLKAHYQRTDPQGWVGKYLGHLRSIGGVDEDIKNLGQATAGSLVGMISRTEEVPGPVLAALTNPLVVQAYQSGDLARHLGIDVARKVMPLMDKYHKGGVDGPPAPDGTKRSRELDAFNYAAVNSVYKPTKSETAKLVRSNLLSDYNLTWWEGRGKDVKLSNKMWYDAEAYAGSSVDRRMEDGASQQDALARTRAELDNFLVKTTHGYIPRDMAGNNPEGAAATVVSQLKALGKIYGKKTDDFQYTYQNGRLFFMLDGMMLTEGTLAAQTPSSQEGTQFVRDAARQEIKRPKDKK